MRIPIREISCPTGFLPGDVGPGYLGRTPNAATRRADRANVSTRPGACRGRTHRRGPRRGRAQRSRLPVSGQASAGRITGMQPPPAAVALAVLEPLLPGLAGGHGLPARMPMRAEPAGRAFGPDCRAAKAAWPAGGTARPGPDESRRSCAAVAQMRLVSLFVLASLVVAVLTVPRRRRQAEGWRAPCGPGRGRGRDVTRRSSRAALARAPGPLAQGQGARAPRRPRRRRPAARSRPGGGRRASPARPGPQPFHPASRCRDPGRGASARPGPGPAAGKPFPPGAGGSRNPRHPDIAAPRATGPGAGVFPARSLNA